MNRAQALTDVVRRAALLPEGRTAAVGDVDEALADVRSGEPVQELFVRRRETIVGFVCASPEGVSADGGQFPDNERCVVGWYRLERDVRVLR